jgi:hypothetical protein
MADGLLPLNFVTNTKKLVFSDTNPSEIRLPAFYQEDGIDLRFKALKQVSQVRPPFLEKINLNGWSLRISVGSAGASRAAQVTWDPGADAYEVVGVVDLNTADISTALGSSESITQTLEIRLTKGTTVYRGAWQVQIKKSVALAGALVAPVNDTALGRLEGTRMFVLREGEPGAGIILTSKNSLAQRFVYCHDDGSLRSPRIR